MAGERSAELELMSWGKENTPGVAVAAALILASTNATAKPVEPVTMLRPDGFVSDLMAVRQAGVMTNIALKGAGTVFDDLILWTSSAFKAGAFTTPANAVLARDFTILPAYMAPGDGTGVTFTAEGRGSDGSASRVDFCSVTGFEIDISQAAVGFSGTMIGRQYAEEGIVSTATPAPVSLIPAPPTGVDLYIADTLANLDAGNGQMMRFFNGKFSVGDRRTPVFPRQSALGGTYVALAQGANKCMAHIEIENDAQSYALLRRLRESRMGLYRLIVRGPLIESTGGGANKFYHELEITQAFQVANPDRGPIDKVYGGMYDLMAVPDLSMNGLGSFVKIRIRTTMTALPAAADLGGAQQPEALDGTALTEDG